MRTATAAVLCSALAWPSAVRGDTEPSTTPATERKVLRDPEADARLKEALKGTSPELAEMIPLSGGTYMMGDPLYIGAPARLIAALVAGGGAFGDQETEHEVTVDGFYLGKYEVTAEQFVCFLNAIESKDCHRDCYFYGMRLLREAKVADTECSCGRQSRASG